MITQGKSTFCECSMIVLISFFGASSAVAQKGSSEAPIPDAPASHLIAQAAGSGSLGSGPAENQATGAVSDPSSDQLPKLTRAQAEQLAIKNNPRVSVAHLLALAQHEVVRETRSAELPTANASLTAVDAENGSRISAGYLTASSLFEHAGAGGSFTQLITDFGKTANLVASSKLQEKAQNSNALATQGDIALATDQVFYETLQAQTLLQVARQNVTTRQTLESQVSQMTLNKLKSTLDLSFADVNLSQAKLLLLDAQNNADSSMAGLDAVLGLDHLVTYELTDDNANTKLPENLDKLIEQGLQQRPDLQSMKFNQEAATKLSRAQRDQMFPTVSAAGTAGSVPIRPDQFYTANWWGGVGMNVNVPIFNGFLYSAQAKEAAIRAQAAAEQTRDLRDRIVRDVRTSWLAANSSFQRLSVTAELLNQANLALKLAQTRYQMGLSSIVELSQAEYQQTDAAIGNTNAQYQYRLALATLNYQIGSTP
jgi:outer membrane protein